MGITCVAAPFPLSHCTAWGRLPTSFPVLVGAKWEPTTLLLVKLAAGLHMGLEPPPATWSGAAGCWRAWFGELRGTSHAGGRSRSPATPSSPSLCPSGTHRGSAGCRGAEANVSPATATAPRPQAPPSPPTSPALSNAAPATSSAPGRPVAPLATPPTSWCCGESGATSPWQPRAPHWDTGTFGDVPCVSPPPPLSLCTQRASFFSPSYATSRTCPRYEAGAATTYTLPRHRVYVLTNTTAWVEAQWGPHLHRSPNLTLYLNEAGKRREAGLGAPRPCRSPQPRCPRSEAGSSPRRDEFRQGQGAPAAPGAAAAVPRQGPGAEQGGSLPRGGQPQLDAGKALVARSGGGFAEV